MNMFKNVKEDMKNAWMKFMKTLTFKCNNKKNLSYGNQIEQRNDSPKKSQTEMKSLGSQQKVTS